MEIMEKLGVLSEAARYDAACDFNNKGIDQSVGFKSLNAGSICHAWSADGRCVGLFKVLMTNVCSYDCVYCINRRSNDIPRAAFEPEELVKLTLDFFKRNYIEGLFLSSAVPSTPDHAMEKMLRVVRSLRVDYGFKGYIHLKVIPGTSPELVKQAGFYADRMSVNIELPSPSSLKMLAPDKTKNDIFSSMSELSGSIQHSIEDRKSSKYAKSYSPAGQSTQMIVGATPESDFHIIKLSENLYHRFQLRRVYYSAYMPVNEDCRLPSVYSRPPLLREHRLYQADWLLRYYHFHADEIVDQDHPDLDTDVDPKTAWSVRHPEFFPVEILKADRETLLRVPGIGHTSVKRILGARSRQVIRFEDLRKTGMVMKRAKYFITLNGCYYGEHYKDSNDLKRRLVEKSSSGQMELWPGGVY